MISIQRSQASILLDHFRGEREQMKHLIFIISMLPYTLLGSDVPDYRRWYQEVKPELIEANLARRLLYVKKNGENWRIVRGPKKSLYSAMPALYHVFLKKNFFHVPIVKTEDGVKELIDHLPIDGVAFLDKNGAEIFHQNTNGDWTRTKIKKKKSKKVASVKWMLKKMGFDAMVLGRRGDFLLVRSLKNIKRDAQALTLKDSHQKLRLRKKEKVGSSLIQHIGGKGKIGLFEILIRDEKSSSIRPGTKLVLGKEVQSLKSKK